MRLPLLFAEKFDEYFSFDTPQDVLWFMVHVPKTAGSSLAAELHSILKPNRNIILDKNDTYQPGVDRWSLAMQDFLKVHRNRRFKLAHGHVSVDHAEKIRKHEPALRYITVLRHPVARQISGYHYMRSTMNKNSVEFCDRYPTLRVFVEKRFRPNLMTSMLVPRKILRGGSCKECYDYILANFDFVGLQENYDLSFQAVTKLVGKQSQQTEVRRVNTKATEPEAADLLAEIEERSAIDMAIFSEFQANFNTIQSKLSAYLTNSG